MKKNILYLVTTCVLLSSLSALASQCRPSQKAITSSHRMKAKKQANKVVSVSKSKPSFTVTLPSNATTGYSWFLVRCNHKLITPVSATYIAPENKKMMGAPGKMQWRFKVTAAGLSVPRVMTIVLAYSRPWQPMVSAQHYRIAVVSQ